MPVTSLSAQLKSPDPRNTDKEGLLAVGGDFSVERLLLADRSGIFQWSARPFTWWSPDPRAILGIVQIHVPYSLARAILHEDLEVSIDSVVALATGEWL